MYNCTVLYFMIFTDFSHLSNYHLRALLCLWAYTLSYIICQFRVSHYYGDPTTSICYATAQKIGDRIYTQWIKRKMSRCPTGLVKHDDSHCRCRVWKNKHYSACAVVTTGIYLKQWWCYIVQGAHAGGECYWSWCILSATEGCHKVAASAAAVLRVCRRRQQQLEA